MEVNYSEQEQIEALQKWWAENGKSIIGGLIIGIAAVFGWRAWEAHTRALAEQASDLYTNMIIEMRDQKNDKAREYASRIIKDYSRTSYADFAALTLARLDVEEAKPDDAAGHLRKVIDHADQDSLKHLARLRLARVLLNQDKTDEARSVLQVSDEGAFAPAYAELKGDIYARQGKFDEARAAYEQVIGKDGGETSDTSLLQMKIDNLEQQSIE